MANEIIPYLEMCQREGASLQRGMNFGLGGTHSVILMSLRRNAPYADRLEDDGSVLIYEGHDVSRTISTPTPKSFDQPAQAPSGRPTQNGRFHLAAEQFKAGKRPPERVRVYEKIHTGIWSYNGVFHLVDSWLEVSGGRRVFKFKLVAVEEEARQLIESCPCGTDIGHYQHIGIGTARMPVEAVGGQGQLGHDAVLVDLAACLREAAPQQEAHDVILSRQA